MGDSAGYRRIVAALVLVPGCWCPGWGGGEPTTGPTIDELLASGKPLSIAR
jgi:hypothetical protein